MSHVEKAQALKQELLNRLEKLGPSLPNNMLDQLIDALGGVENVAEVGAHIWCGERWWGGGSCLV